MAQLPFSSMRGTQRFTGSPPAAWNLMKGRTWGWSSGKQKEKFGERDVGVKAEKKRDKEKVL